MKPLKRIALSAAGLLVAIAAAFVVLPASAQTSPPCPAERNAGDYASLQAAIDACPGVVHVGPGDWSYSAPILLPRTTLGGLGGVSLVGAGVGQTRLVPVFGTVWEESRGVIEWRPADGVIRRAWDQSISDLTIVMPTGENAVGIKYQIASDYDLTGLEKSSGSIKRVRIEPWNDWEQIGIQIRGVAHHWVIEDVQVDPGSRTTVAYDAKAIVVDSGPTTGTYGGDSGLDNGGLYASRITGLVVSGRTGGPASMFEGRCQFCTFNNWASGNGTLGSPLIHLVRSGAVTLTNFYSEGKFETAAIKLEQSRGVTLDTIAIGTPDLVAGVGGDGIVMNDVEDSSVRNWVVWPGKQEWGRAVPGAERLRLDAATTGVRWDAPIGNDNLQGDGGEDPAVVLVDLGLGNDILARNVGSGAVVDRTRIGGLTTEAVTAAGLASSAAGIASVGSAQAVTVAGAAAVQAAIASSATAATTATLERVRAALADP